MEKIRIAFFADILLRDIDGCNRTIFHILKRLPKNLFEIKFFSGKFPNEDFDYDKCFIPSIKIPFNPNYNLSIPNFKRVKIEKSLRVFNPDVIHVTTPSMLGHFAVNYANKNHIPVSTIYHTHFISYVDYYLRNFKQLIPLAKKIVIDSNRKFYNSCDKIFVPTESMIQTLTDIGIHRSSMSLWPRGINKSIFSPLKSDKDYFKNITGNSKSNILFASRLVWEKNLQTLQSIYKRAKEQQKPYNFIIAGDGIARTELERTMPDAFFLGNVSQEHLSKIYASADAFLFPSISETYGNVVIEAMSSGLPCVIANGGGSKEFIKHMHNGILCPPNSAESYISGIDLILNNILISNKFKLNSLALVKNLDWDTLVKNFSETIIKLSEKNLLPYNHNQAA